MVKKYFNQNIGVCELVRDKLDNFHERTNESYRSKEQIADYLAGLKLMAQDMAKKDPSLENEMLAKILENNKEVIWEVNHLSHEVHHEEWQRQNPPREKHYDECWIYE
jgi:hypothetical protein